MATEQFLNYEGLVELVAKIKENFANIEAIEYKGSVANIASLPTIATTPIGSMYSIVAGGTTTSDFVEGAGHDLPAGANVIAVNTETDTSLPAVMKWDVVPGVFKLDDRLQFGNSMPLNPVDEQTFLYMGDTTFSYDEVTPAGTEDPSEEGWYEYDSVQEEYVLSQDTTVDTQKTYYEKNEEYVHGVIYVYDDTTHEWVAQSSGTIMVPITNAAIDALFD